MTQSIEAARQTALNSVIQAQSALEALSEVLCEPLLASDSTQDMSSYMAEAIRATNLLKPSLSELLQRPLSDHLTDLRNNG